ncbi:hypothetical protein B0H14DRAFT_2601607 [Mycena olivaceomarginata]|nr:hypothetical protein B0H14DRAFT_2601607 [Mycena olivaceomarginata]
MAQRGHRERADAEASRLAFQAAISGNGPLIVIINWVDEEPCPPFNFVPSDKVVLGEGVRVSCSTSISGCSVSQYGEDHLNSSEAGNPHAGLSQVVGVGRKCQISLQKTADRGWGIFAAKTIEPGTFIGAYTGVLFKRADESKLSKLIWGSDYTFELDFPNIPPTSERYAVDGANRGNFTRYIVSVNSLLLVHLVNLDSNVESLVNAHYISGQDVGRPGIAIFSCKRIAAKEELTICYHNPPGKGGEGADVTPDNACRCKARHCHGFIFVTGEVTAVDSLPITALNSGIRTDVPRVLKIKRLQQPLLANNQDDRRIPKRRRVSIP